MRELVIALAITSTLPSLALAQETPPAHDEPITVWGVRHKEIGQAFSATEGSVDFGRFADRPLLRVGELAEVVPGLAATQHSGTGKANQYFLRGFNLDHGTDFSISLDGMPINLRTHAHGQGYLDINFLIPEIIETINYRKGPYGADTGDFSAAGAAQFHLFSTLPESFAQAELGENQWQRFVGGVNFGERGFAAVDLTDDDGPWDLPQKLRKQNGLARINLGSVSVDIGAYDARWNSTDQIPLRAVQSGLVSPLGNIDPTDGGETQRLFVNVLHEGETLKWNAYAQRYTLDLFSNFTYFLDDPVDGDQFNQADRRMIYGGSITKSFDEDLLGRWRPRIGAEMRYDDISRVGLYHTIARQQLGVVREDAVEQLSGAAWGDVSGAFGPVRINLGLRADSMSVHDKSDNPLNTGDESATIVSPKASLAWQVADGFELYASAGRGFHSNDARGATSVVDPATGDAVDRAPLLVKATGAELGARLERGRFSGSVAVWGLDLASELVFAGDSGASEPSGETRRYGVEALATYSPAEWLTLDASAAWTHARFRDAPGADRVPLAAEYVITGGATVHFTPALLGTLTVRTIGSAPLIEDDSARSDPSTVVNGRLAYKIGRYTIALEGLNLLDSKDEDITYFYTSRLAGEPPEGVDDYHVHPIEPRSFRVQLRARF
ncbi:MAG: TonB-dependent receptor [Alphaproteobacteria bacterium]